MDAKIYTDSWKKIKSIYIHANSTWNSVKKGYIYVVDEWKQFFSSQIIPIQTASPTISGGTGGYAYPFTTSINGVTGTYTSGTYTSKSSYIGWASTDITPVDGETTSSVTPLGSPPYKVKQVDITPIHKFYYVDAVVSGSKTYYYYSSSLQSKVGVLTDDFERTVASGLGAMTPIWDNTMNPKSYIYNLKNRDSDWSVDGTRVVITVAPTSSDAPSNYPLQSVELSGKTDITAKVNIPSVADGMGLAFWVTGSGSWWASAVTHTKDGPYTSYGTACGTSSDYSGSCANGDGSIGSVCGCFNYTALVCGSYFTVSSCGTTCLGNCSAGDQCNCIPQTTYSCPSGYGSPYQQGGSWYCQNQNIPYNIIGATPSTTYSRSNYENSARNTHGTVYQTSSTYYNYNTQTRIYSANGSAVTVQASKEINTNTSDFVNIRGLKVSTSGNIITSKAYSDTLYATQVGDTLLFTAIDPIKTKLDGSTYAGLIVVPEGITHGFYFDNLSIE